MNNAIFNNLAARTASPYLVLSIVLKILFFALCTILIAGCASRSGGYYKDDGPGAKIPANIASIPNAVPKIEQHKAANFRPYTVFGVRYSPIGENQQYSQKGIASWYGKKFHGQKTANGEIYDMYAMTAAHPTLPLPSYAKVTRPANGRSVIVRINDRGPFHTDRIIDLSYAAAAKLGLIGPGSGTVIVEAITNNDIMAGNYGDKAEPTAKPVAEPKTVAVAAPANIISSSLDTNNTDNNHQNNIYLQFGAFASSTNAQSLAERINRQSGVYPEITRQADLYKVRMGPYSSRNQADQEANKLQAQDLQPTISIDMDI